LGNLNQKEVDILTLKQAGLINEIAKVVKVIKTGEIKIAVKLGTLARGRKMESRENGRGALSERLSAKWGRSRVNRRGIVAKWWRL